MSCRQVHSGIVRPATGDLRPATDCDALWSNEKSTALVIKTADCLPVTLIDTRGVIANIHSGWRGALQNITAATLDAAPLDPANTTAWLGPTIRVCCFEVGEEVASQFDPRWVDRTRGPKPHVDIPALTESVLRGRGVQVVIDTKLCTRCAASQPRNLATSQPLFHSYRRNKRSGRNLAIVAQ